MKNFTELYQTLQNPQLTIACLTKITRHDGIIQGFTTHDSDITYQNTLYHSTPSFSLSDFKLSNDLRVDNMEIEFILNHLDLKKEDILAGKYDNAEIEIVIINYNQIALGHILIMKGNLGEFEISEGKFHTEIRGKKQKLLNNIGEIYSSKCRATLGDKRCNVQLDSHTYTGKILSYTNYSTLQSDITPPSAQYFLNGILTIQSGANINSSFEIISVQTDGLIKLKSKIIYVDDIIDADIKLVAGCGKNTFECKNKFNNLINFRGEPYIPGNESLLTR